MNYFCFEDPCTRKYSLSFCRLLCNLSYAAEQESQGMCVKCKRTRPGLGCTFKEGIKIGLSASVKDKQRQQLYRVLGQGK